MKKQNSAKRERQTDAKNENASGAGLFIKTFFVSTAVLLSAVFSGALVLANLIKPPEVSAQTSDGEKPDDGLSYEDVAAPFPDGHEDDKYVGRIIGNERLQQTDKKDNFYTFLIVGIDKGYNTDTIMVASYDGSLKTANIVSVPRDTLVNVSRAVKKINVAFGAGTRNGGGTEGGVDQLKREIRTIVGFLPDFYILVDLKAFERIVDAVGGVDVYNSYNMNYDDPWQDLHIHFNKGSLHLNGADALRFARWRQNNDNSGGSDYSRIGNQQAVMKAVAAKLLTPESILKIPEFIDIFNTHIKTDLKNENLLWFATQIKEVAGADALSTYTMPTCGTSGTPNWYELLDEDAVVELVNKTINPYLTDIGKQDVDIIISSSKP